MGEGEREREVGDNSRKGSILVVCVSHAEICVVEGNECGCEREGEIVDG